MTSSSFWRVALGVVIVAVSPALVHAQPAQPAPVPPPPSAATLETARALYNEGKDLRARGDLGGALAKFRAAHELGRTPITGIELARTQAAAGQLLEARETCLGVARIPVTAAETDRSTAARQEAAQLAEELRPKIPSVLIRLQNVPPGAMPVVTLDRVQVPPLAEPFKVNPGRHEVSARLPRGPESFVMVDLAEGQMREVVLPLAPEPPLPPGMVLITPAPYPVPASAPPPGFEPQAPRSTRPLSSELVVAGAVTAGVGLVLGAVFGGLAIERTNYVREHCPDHRCPPFAHDALDAANNYGLVSTVSLAIGAVGLLIASIGATPTKRAVVASPGGIRGTF